ncbi:MAG: hypothetical protein M5U28_51585 [Sandaracinaceae bacterium]|nr:hypothetical protein [Sandaracinaceae bacterium]
MGALLAAGATRASAQEEAAEEPAEPAAEEGAEPAPPEGEPSEEEAEPVAEAGEDEGEDEAEDEGEEGEGEADEGRPVGAERTGRVRYVIERVEIRGNTRTDTGLIRSFLRCATERWSTSRIRASRAGAGASSARGWFEDVRLRLERGSERGRVVLVVQVRERNTFVVQGVALGISEGVLDSLSPNTQIEPYFGISVAETNLFGTGVGLAATALLSVPQQGVRLRAGVGSLPGTDWGLSGALFFNNGREFFGNDDVVVAVDECPRRIRPCPASAA